MAWVGLSGIAFLLAQIFQCHPIAFVWEGWKKGEFGPHRCVDVNLLTYLSAASNIAQDAAILILPLPVLVRLQVALRTKIAIVVMFSLGVFVLLTSCVRLWAIHGFGDSPNPTWDYTDAVIWTGLEVAVSIIVTSLPAIRVLAQRRRSRKLGPQHNVPRSSAGRQEAGAEMGAVGASWAETSSTPATVKTLPGAG